MLAPHISVLILGCRGNRVESDRSTADLMRLGFAMVEPQDADLIVINTCAVTGEAGYGILKTLSCPDAELTRQGIDEGDTVLWDGTALRKA